MRWNVILKVSESSGKYDTAVFGEVDDASDGKDNYDTPKPPAPGQPYIRSWFEAELNPPYNELWADYRDYPDTFESWDLYIKTNTTPPSIGDTDVTITWDSDDINSTEYDIVELWDDTVKLADMKINNDYNFSADFDLTYHFQIKCRMLYTPNAPIGFTASAVSTNEIDLVWTLGSNSDKTYVEWNSSSIWNLGEGTLLFNGTGTSTSHTGLSPHTMYYYQAWGCNETDGMFSSSYASDDDMTWNTPPACGAPSPVNESTGIDLSLTWSIPISDDDGDSFDWSIECSNGQSTSSADADNWIDSVDDNTSDKDSTADKGIESNFDNCKETAPDNDVMTLTEANQGIPAIDEYRYVNSWTGEGTDWTETGISPYINTVEGSSYIESGTGGEDEYWFTFDDTTETGSGFIVTVECYATGDNNDDITIYCDYTGDKVSDATVTCTNPTTTYNWIASGTISGCDTVTEINALQCWYEEYKQGGQGTIRIDCSRIHITRPAGTPDYELDMEYQFNDTNYNCTNEQVCLFLTGSVTENILVDYYNSGWVNLGTISSTGWNNFTATGLSSGTYNIRIYDQNQTNEITQDNWTIDCMFLHCWNTSTTDYELNISGLNYNTLYTVWVNASDDFGGSVSEWFVFTTRGIFEPDAPTGFTASVVSKSQIDLSWTLGANSDKTYIEWNTTSGWSIGEGTLLYNDTVTSTSHSGLDPHTSYYYQAWGWNETDGMFSSSYASDDDMTWNTPPACGTPSPVNESTGIDLSLTWNISINDGDGDSFDWRIECSNSQSNNSTGDSNGTKSLSVSGLNYDTLYTVWVNASDGFDSVSEWFVFTTKIIPNVISLHTNWNLISLPFNESINKTDIVVSYAGTNYSWSDAVTNNIILGFIYGWNNTNQNYETKDVLDPGYGYWVWAYHNCDLLVSGNITDDGYITALQQRWNIIGLPYNTSVNKQNLTINYNGTDYTWQQAVNSNIILGFVYGWDRNTQNYMLSDSLDPDNGYWMYAYYDCILKK